ncbi:MAG: methyltransferase domain-containing protein [Alphaproteobacteria bacterium]
MPANEDQIKFWNEKAGQDWTMLQERMDANLAAIGDAVLAFAAARPGETVLDVGCGTGFTSLALARAGAKVTGLDVSKPMLGLARSRAIQAGLDINFIEADASAYAFKPEYDLIFSRFGVMFFDDPIGAFANLHKALKPGGRLAFVCWRTAPENLWAFAPLAAAKPLLPEQPPPDPNAPGPFAFADPQRVLSILTDTGFHDVETRPYDGVMRMGTDIATIAAQTLQIGPLSRAVGEADDATKGKIVEAVRAAMEKFRTPDGEIAPPTACWLVSARKEQKA